MRWSLWAPRPPREWRISPLFIVEPATSRFPVPQTLITNVQIFDGVSDKLTPGNVLVEANLIKEIADSISAPFVASPSSTSKLTMGGSEASE
jgi:hypothetical protein